MEYSIGAVAKRMILVIVCLSVLIALGGYLFYRSAEAWPFAAGVALAAGVNVIKVLWLKRAVNKAVDREAMPAKLYLQGQYFLRLLFTGAAFVAAGLLHGTFINLFGMVIAIFTLPVATYSINFFLKGQHPDILTGSAAGLPTNSAQDAINEINAIVAEKEASQD